MPQQKISVPTDIYEIARRGTGDPTLPDLDTGESNPDTRPPLDSGNVEEPSTRQKVFEWNAGDISDASWDAMRQQIIDDGYVSDGRPKPPGSPNYLVEITDTTSMQAIVNYEVPIITGGRILANITDSSFNPHSMVRGRAKDVLPETFWLYSKTTYRFDLEFEFLDSVGWLDDINWVILFQIWGQFGSKWQNPNESPPFALLVDRDSYPSLRAEVHMRGSSDATASDWEYESTEDYNAPISPTGTHSATVWWRKDHLGLDSACRVIVDGTTLCDVTGVKLGTPLEIGGAIATSSEDAAGGTPNFGVYTSSDYVDPGVQVYFDKYEISVVEEVGD